MQRICEPAATLDQARPQRLMTRDGRKSRVLKILRTIALWDEYFHGRPRSRRSLLRHAT